MTNKIPFQDSLEHILAVLEDSVDKGPEERLDALKSISKLPSKYIAVVSNAEERIKTKTGFDKEFRIHDLRNSLYSMPLSGVGFFNEYEFLPEFQEIGDPCPGKYFRHPIANITERCYPYEEWTRRTFTKEDQLTFAKIFREGLKEFREICLVGHKISGLDGLEDEFLPGYLQSWGQDSYEKVIRILEEEFEKIEQ